ncbi:hypothetical protein Syun_004292 [Stephania yunnanensis]|uniref:Beta-glucosidase n=1 Tax=Stephania yunnanensis TaxID=152371 RepID=A0AAP0Q1B0_9MAGN
MGSRAEVISQLALFSGLVPLLTSLQIEGAADEDGRKPGIWDTYTHAGRMIDKSIADIASNQYHHYKEDVKLMHDMGIEPNHCKMNTTDIEDFTAYADICFKEFSDKVKNWITFNEPNIQTISRNDLGIGPPSRCSYPFGVNYSIGNSKTEPYIGAVSDSPKDIAARQRVLDFQLVGFRSSSLKSSCVFIGLNHYSAYPMEDLPRIFSKYGSDYVRDVSVKGLFSKSLLQMKFTSLFDLRSMQKMLEIPSSWRQLQCASSKRYSANRVLTKLYWKLASFHKNGSDIRGYFVWSLMDCFELMDGYRSHYGLYAVDFNDAKRKSYPRMSAKWFSYFLAKENNRAGISSY